MCYLGINMVFIQLTKPHKSLSIISCKMVTSNPPKTQKDRRSGILQIKILVTSHGRFLQGMPKKHNYLKNKSERSDVFLTYRKQYLSISVVNAPHFFGLCWAKLPNTNIKEVWWISVFLAWDKITFKNFCLYVYLTCHCF